MKFAICVISYNRPSSTRRCLEALNKAYYGEDSVDLIISIDYSGQNDVEKVANNFEWKYGKKRVIAHSKNLGLRKHVLSCGNFTQEYDGLIVLEDDIFVAPSFFQYAKSCVNEYSENESIAGISLYSFHINYHNFLPFTPETSDSDVYLMQNAQSWGQVWMKKQWQAFKVWYDNNSDQFPNMPHLPRSICGWEKSWLKYHTRYCIETNRYFIYPYVSQSTCFSDVGEHTNTSNTLIQVPIGRNVKSNYRLNPSIKYDAFFENMALPELMGYRSDEICIDLYGEKDNRENKRYWLSRKVLDLKVIRAFALELKPIENNILFDVKGNRIFLYDTTIEEKNTLSKKTDPTNFFSYIYNIRVGVKGTINMAAQAIKHKLQSLLQC